MIAYQVEKLDDIMGSLKPLITAHYEEIAMFKDKMELKPNYEAYYALEAAGSLRIMTARDDEELIGYFITFIQPNLHYSDHVMGVNDILYIDKEYRGHHMGIRLFKEAEKDLKGLGVSIIHIHAKVYADFGPMLKKLGYDHTENNYSKFIGE